MSEKTISTYLDAVAAAFARFAGHCGHVLAESVQHAYDVHQERAQMRLASTEQRSWRDVQRARAGCR